MHVQPPAAITLPADLQRSAWSLLGPFYSPPPLWELDCINVDSPLSSKPSPPFFPFVEYI